MAGKRDDVKGARAELIKVLYEYRREFYKQKKMANGIRRKLKVYSQFPNSEHAEAYAADLVNRVQIVDALAGEIAILNGFLGKLVDKVA